MAHSSIPVAGFFVAVNFCEIEQTMMGQQASLPRSQLCRKPHCSTSNIKGANGEILIAIHIPFTHFGVPF